MWNFGTFGFFGQKAERWRAGVIELAGADSPNKDAQKKQGDAEAGNDE